MKLNPKYKIYRLGNTSIYNDRLLLVKCNVSMLIFFTFFRLLSARVLGMVYKYLSLFIYFCSHELKTNLESKTDVVSGGHNDQVKIPWTKQERSQ